MRFIFASALFSLAVSAVSAESSCDDLINKPTDESSVPDAIKVSPQEGKFFLRVYADGTQNYMCGGGNWTLVEPEATLRLNKGLKSAEVGKHFFLKAPDSNGGKAGWECRDKKCGQVITKKVAEAPSPEKGSIAWLKTAMTSTDGQGPVAGATFVLRVKTNGGAPPPVTDCGKGKKFAENAVYKSKYTAQYYFYKSPSAKRRM